MSTLTKQYLRRQERRFTTTGQVPTVPTVADHKTTGWLDTDIYIGEIVINTADDKMYTRTAGGIVEITGSSSSSLWQQNGIDIGYAQGKVGVGTTSPDADLDVQGKIAATDGLNAMSMTDNFLGAGVEHIGVSRVDGDTFFLNGIDEFSPLTGVPGWGTYMMYRDLANGNFSAVDVTPDGVLISTEDENAIGSNLVFNSGDVNFAIYDSAGNFPATMKMNEDLIRLARDTADIDQGIYIDTTALQITTEIDSLGINAMFSQSAEDGVTRISYTDGALVNGVTVNDANCLIVYEDLNTNVKNSFSISEAGLYCLLNDSGEQGSLIYDSDSGLSVKAWNQILSSLLFTLRDSNDVIISSIDNSGHLFANSISVNTQNTSPTAVLQVDSTTQGFLPPRMTTTERDAIATPEEGLVIYNTTTKTLQFHNSFSWVDV